MRLILILYGYSIFNIIFTTCQGELVESFIFGTRNTQLYFVQFFLFSRVTQCFFSKGYRYRHKGILLMLQVGDRVSKPKAY